MNFREGQECRGTRNGGRWPPKVNVHGLNEAGRARLEVAVLAPMMMHDQASSIADNNNKQGREHDHPVARTAGAVDRKATLWCDESCRIRII